MRIIEQINAAVVTAVKLEEELVQLRDERIRFMDALCFIRCFGHTVGDAESEARMTDLCKGLKCPCFCGNHYNQPFGEKV